MVLSKIPVVNRPLYIYSPSQENKQIPNLLGPLKMPGNPNSIFSWANIPYDFGLSGKVRHDCSQSLDSLDVGLVKRE